MNIHPLISVIVPVYNVELYLKRCIDSLVCQDYRNLEIILVDDGSTDNCGLICDNYARKHSNIHVFHKENGGLSDARNVGLEYAMGEYIAFVDSDDWVTPYYISHMYSAIKQTGTTIAMSSVRKVYSYEITCRKKMDNMEVISAEECLKRILYRKKIDVSAYAKLYERKILNQLRFPKGKIYEDFVFTPYAISRAKEIALISNTDYYYYQREDSICHQKFGKRSMDMVSHVASLKNFIYISYPELKLAADNRYFAILCTMVMQLPKDGHDGLRRKLWNKIKKYRRSIFMDCESTMNNRLGAAISYFGFPVFAKIYRVIKK